MVSPALYTSADTMMLAVGTPFETTVNVASLLVAVPVALLTSARRAWQPARMLETAGGAASGQRMFDRGEIAASLRARGFTGITERYAGVAQIVAGRLG